MQLKYAAQKWDVVSREDVVVWILKTGNVNKAVSGTCHMTPAAPGVTPRSHDLIRCYHLYRPSKVSLSLLLSVRTFEISTRRFHLLADSTYEFFSSRP